MKPGDKIPIVLEVVESVKEGTMIQGDNGSFMEVSNHLKKLWWAVPLGSKQPLILVCSDMESEAGIIKRKAVVALIQCGVGSC